MGTSLGMRNAEILDADEVNFIEDRGIHIAQAQRENSRQIPQHLLLRFPFGITAWDHRYGTDEHTIFILLNVDSEFGRHSDISILQNHLFCYTPPIHGRTRSRDQ